MNKKLIYLGIFLIILIVLTLIFIISNSSKTSYEEFDEFYNQKIASNEMIYYERCGSSSVERVSFIYYEGKECILYTRYFNCGQNKVVTEKLSNSKKEEIINAINSSEPANIKNSSTEYIAVGGNSFSASQYINNTKSQNIQPIDLEKLNLVKNVTDIF